MVKLLKKSFMCKVGLLILLFKAIKTQIYRVSFLVCVLFLFGCLSSCKIALLPKNLANDFYVDYATERLGMMIRARLISYYPNRDQKSAKYIIKVYTSSSDSLFLTSKAGYATKGIAALSVKMVLESTQEHKVVYTFSSVYSENYSVDSSGFSVENNKVKAYDTLSIVASKDIYARIYRFLYSLNRSIDASNYDISNTYQGHEDLDTLIDSTRDDDDDSALGINTNKASTGG